jgi:hypothetical protein
MSKSHGGKIEGQFVYLLYSMMDCPAWKSLSCGARSLYTELKRGVSKGRSTAYLSLRVAEQRLGASRHKVREWYAELKHYGFIVDHLPGCLGVDGKGKAPHYRLTELGTTSKTSANGLPDIPTREYLKWDGVLFDPALFRYSGKFSDKWTQKQNPGVDALTTLESTPTPPLESTPTPRRLGSGVDALPIQAHQGGVSVLPIPSSTTMGDSEASASADLRRLREVRTATGGEARINGRKGKIGR